MEKSRDVESLRRVFTAEDDPITKELSASYWTDGWGVPMQLDRTEVADSVKMRIYSSHNAPEGDKWRRLYVDIVFHRLADGKFRVEVKRGWK
ncbi:hypothetical protein J8F10_18005 [Gemmata sp. G18]|uniref:Uncharacterized protein n=1 Tax=Gemmata palustris TaxID=2822762 RepID=A0ABS5BU25_9BACT|nr:hypothetical protein [Gemmata palustris]MBP3957161.1 hypothetical protein [Gemmata palustris]